MRFKRFAGYLTVISVILNIFTMSVFAEDAKNPLTNITINNSTVSAASGNGYAQRLTGTVGGGWVKIDNIDFGRGKMYGSVTIAAGVDDQYAGGVVKYYLDDLQSVPIAEVTIKSTNNNWLNFTEQTAELDDPSIQGIHSLYITTSKQGTCDATYIRFNELKQQSDMVLPEDVEGSRAEEAVKKLASFGIINIDPSEKLEIEKEVDGDELVSASLGIIKCDDVLVYPKFKKYCGYNVTGTATIGDAARIISYITGDGIKIDALGKGTNLSYYTAAKKNGILKGISENVNEPLTRELLYIILANACEAEIYLPYSAGVGGVVIKNNGETILNRYWDIYDDEGIVDGDSKTFLNEAEPAGIGLAAIDGKTYTCSRYKAENYLGQKVKFYYNDAYEIVYMASKDNKITQINGKDIEDFDGSRITYLENDKRKTLKLSGDFSVVYNGRAKTKFDLKLFEGCQNAVFIDNNKDDRIDVIQITNAYNFIVNSVSDKKIYGKFGVGILDFGNDEVNIVNGVGKVYDEDRMSNIAEWSVLSVSVSYSKDETAYYDAVISSAGAFGTVSKIAAGTDYGTKQYFIGGSWYETDKNVIYENNNSISIGDDVKAYINSYGKIAVICKTMLSSKYGFVTSVVYDENNSDDEEVYVKIFTEDGNFVRVNTAEKVTIDSVTVKRKSEIRDKIKGTGEFNGVFVIYTLNVDGKLRKIDLPYNKEAGEQPGKNESPDSLHITAKNFTGRNRKVPMSFSGKVFYDADTKVFIIPTDIKEEKYFRVTDKSTFAEDNDYTVDAYQVRNDSFVADAVVRRVESVGEEDIREHYYLYFFNDSEYIYDEAADEVYMEIEYLKNGEMVKQRIDSDMEETALGLNRGDGILFSEDMDRNIMFIKKVYDVKSGTYPTETTEWNSGRRNISGTVDIKYTNHFKLKGNDEVFNGNTNETTIAIYDSQRNKLIPGSVSDIIDSTSGEPSKVFMRLYYGIPRSILIIK